MAPTEIAEAEELQSTHSTPLETLSERLTFPEKEAPVTDLTTLYSSASPRSSTNEETLVLSDARHGLPLLEISLEQVSSLVSKWRQKERLKTTAVALVVCLNIGVDPPDVIKISPCARMECWVDPMSMQAQKALDTIGKNLQAQYERWQPRAKYKMHLDPTTEDVKKLVVSCRRTAKNERVLFHYNGHGVPRPTSNGEIWVFNKSYTQYIPLSIYDLHSWMGFPAIYVFDCSVAGQVLTSFRHLFRQQQMEQRSKEGNHSSDPSQDVIILCACSENELLPQDPEFPADLFTSCLTTPIKVALHWFCSKNILGVAITKEMIDRIPGKQTDRKTPLGELNWIFTAITDTIAWNVLPRSLFQKLFRQDLLVASLFRNFLLAQRIMQASGCTPISHPRLPPMHQHPMWLAWDMAAEMCLLQLPDLVSGISSKEYQPSSFFSDQLTAFELWLKHGSKDKAPPEQLPIVLQVLLSQVHRLRALVLLGRFLDMGSWAVDLALSVGIFPYILKLLQTSAADLRQTLVFIWTKILAWDTNAQVQNDLIKDGGYVYFIKHLESDDPDVGPESRAQAAFVLTAICRKNPKAQVLCAQSGLLQVCSGQLPAAYAALTSDEHIDDESTKTLELLVKWIVICIGHMCEDVHEIVLMTLEMQIHDVLVTLLNSNFPELRAAAGFSLGSLFMCDAGKKLEGNLGGTGANIQEIVGNIMCNLLEAVYDASPLVRCEVCRALARAVSGQSDWVQFGINACRKDKTSALWYYAGPQSSDVCDAQSPKVESGSVEDEDLATMLVDALYLFGADPSKNVSEYAKSLLSSCGIGDLPVQGPNMYQKYNASSQMISKSSSVGMSSFLPKSWQAKSWRSFAQPSSRSLPNRSGQRNAFLSDDIPQNMPSLTEEGSVSGNNEFKKFEMRQAGKFDSVTYSLSREHFRWPLLQPLAKEEMGLKWLRTCPPTKLQQRIEMRDSGIRKCSNKNLKVRLREQVHAINTGARSIHAILLEPFKAQIVTADSDGVVRTFDYLYSKLQNEFMSNLQPFSKATGVRSLYRLNDLYNELLMCCSASGIVSIWRYYSKPDAQVLATSWRTVLPMGIDMHPPCYDLHSESSGGMLYASGVSKTKKAVINMWDLNKELCISQLSGLSSEEGYHFEHLKASKFGNRLYACGNEGDIVLYDVRSEGHIAKTKLSHDIVGIVPEISGNENSLIVGHRKGTISFLDCRMMGNGTVFTLTNEIEAHSKGSMSAILGHERAPIFATATSSQVVKVWSNTGKQLGVVRPHTSILSQPIGAAKCLAFSPFSMKLASAGEDSICAVYSLEQTE